MLDDVVISHISRSGLRLYDDYDLFVRNDGYMLSAITAAAVPVCASPPKITITRINT